MYRKASIFLFSLKIIIILILKSIKIILLLFSSSVTDWIVKFMALSIWLYIVRHPCMCGENSRRTKATIFAQVGQFGRVICDKGDFCHRRPEGFLRAHAREGIVCNLLKSLSEVMTSRMRARLVNKHAILTVVATIPFPYFLSFFFTFNYTSQRPHTCKKFNGLPRHP